MNKNALRLSGALFAGAALSGVYAKHEYNQVQHDTAPAVATQLNHNGDIADGLATGLLIGAGLVVICLGEETSPQAELKTDLQNTNIEA